MRFERDNRELGDVTRGAGTEPTGIPMGRCVGVASGDDVFGGAWYWAEAGWTRHALVMGAPGSGKTETVLRMAAGLARAEFRQLPVKVVYLDAKNDPDLPGRFGALMAGAQRSVHYFPEQRIDLWRGDWRAVRQRLMQVIPFATTGGASWYRDVAGVLMEYVCASWPEPPRSSDELFRRFAAAESSLVGEAAHPLLTAIDAERIAEVTLRYRNFFAAPGLVFDGKVGLDDVDTAYLRLDSSMLGDESDQALCMLFSDFVHYCKVRKPREELVLLVMDEFSAIARAFEMDRLAEELRSFGVSLVFVPQSLEGMGSEDQRRRLLKSARIKIVHRYEDPQPLIALAGEGEEPEFSFGLEEEGEATGERLRFVDRWRVRPEVVLGLKVGEAVVFREGSAVTVQMDRVSTQRFAELPDQEPIDRDYGRWLGAGRGSSAKPCAVDAVVGESAAGCEESPEDGGVMADPTAFVLEEGLGGEEG